jgi:nucleoside-diphosphate-sugar epimerase
VSQAGRIALVTGGAGFIGSHLVDGLLGEGWQVRVLDDFSSGLEQNLAGSLPRVELLRGDILDEALLSRAVAGVDVVFHQAAIPSVPRSLQEPVRTNEVNITGTLSVLEAARQAGVRRLVFAASSSAYGDTEKLPKVEDMPPNPLSPYALQKYAGEVYCRMFAEHFGLETVALRYFNIFGPRQNPDSPYSAVIPLFVRASLRGEAAGIHGDGEQSRDFTYVTTIQELTGSEIPPKYGPPRAGDVRHSQADIGRARELLGYEPVISLREGLSRTVESFGVAVGGNT